MKEKDIKQPQKRPCIHVPVTYDGFSDGWCLNNCSHLYTLIWPDTAACLTPAFL